MVDQNVDFYTAMCRIRRFEKLVLDNFSKGVFFGTTHTYLGQEADAVGVLAHLSEDDVVFSNHRGHGHFLAYGGDPRLLLAELMGKATGLCGGRGGSQHLHWRNFYSNGVQGGIIPVATGMALAEKYNHSQAVVIAFLGDGTLGEGVIYEAFNMAALWQAPILYVLENNQIAQTTPVARAVAGLIAARFTAFGISCQELDSSDVLEIHAAAGELLEQVREESAPRALIINTRRFGPHSKGDDNRSLQELEQIRKGRDPLEIHAARLNPEQRAVVEAGIARELELAFQQALDDFFPDPASLGQSTFTGRA
jgi:TPP-dependent pyruvate/acetoin dehydrogenase alpha subunit